MTSHVPPEPLSPPPPPRPSRGQAPHPPPGREAAASRPRGGYGPSGAGEPEAGEPAVGGLADVVAMVPHRMGFHPRRSIVAILLDVEGLWIATARHDIHPRVPTGALAAWLADVAQEAHSLLLGVYAQEEQGCQLAEELAEAVWQVGALFVVHESGWLSRLPGAGWRRHGLEEIWSSPLQLEAQAAGSTPGCGAPSHPLDEPDERMRAAWSAACEARAEQLRGIEDYVPPEEGEPELVQRRALRALMELSTRAFQAWDRSLAALDVRGGPAGLAAADWEQLAVALHSLTLLGVRDLLLTSTACPEQDAEDSEVLLGLWEGPVDACGLLRLEVALEATALLLPVRARAEALCMLAWMDWARGHGSVAGETLRRVEELVPGHRLASLMREYLDTGSVPRWLRPSHGGLGAR